jgi:sigma-54 dependent transcriptional regulator, acetoin dehydrogenase operon transcriptional activator AcoR
VSFEDVLVVGRQIEESGLEVNDGAMSRRHAEIRWHKRHGIVELVDLDSKNGVFVNGFETSLRYLELNDIIRFGDTLLAVREAPLRPDPEQRKPIMPGGTLVATFPVSGGRPGTEPDARALKVLSDIIGLSPPMADFKDRLFLAATGTLPVLVLGETGTGKELAAQAIHKLSKLSGAFEAVNCSAVPDSLFESMFFGHRRGAFTGANEDSEGLLVRCDGGTLFLDEIGELPMGAQPKLLRFLEDGMVRPIGGAEQRRVSVRIVAATNAPLHAMESSGDFRSDLFSRLEGVTLTILPLCKRREDILSLFRHFAAQAGIETVRLDADAAEALLVAPWKRNVREVRILASQLAQMVWPRARLEDGTYALKLDYLSPALTRPITHRQAAPLPPEIVSRVRPDRDELLALLDQNDWNIMQVAKELDRDRKQVYRWIERYNLKRN